MSKFFIEIRNRIFFIITTCVSVFIIVYYYKTFILALLLIVSNTFKNDILNYFIFTSIAEIFLIYIKLSIFFTSYIFYYSLIYHFICFLSFGLYKFEYQYIKNTFLISVLLGLSSFLFLNKILIPILFTFFLSYQQYSEYNVNFYFEAKISDYVDLYFSLCNSCFLSFQLSIFLVLFSNYLSINLKLLKTFRKFLYLLLLGFSTLVTPPDVFSQLSLFLILITVFEILICTSVFKNISSKIIV